MQEKNISKSKLLKLQLSGSILVLVVLLVAGFFVFSPVSLEQVAQAVTGNYNKNSGEQLTIDDWNNLDNDFLDKTANDTKQGDLIMGSGNIDMGNTGRIVNLNDPQDPTDAVNQRSMEDAIMEAGTPVLNTDGDALKMVCDNTPPGATNWQLYAPDPHSIQLTVNTDLSSLGFNNTPYYFAYLSGAMTYVTVGTDQIYSPTVDSFVLHVVYLGVDNDYQLPYGGYITPSDANAWQWTVTWCAVGN
jgi:hypothetical protein